MIPQISGGAVQQIEIVPYPSRTYRQTNDALMGHVDGLQAIAQAINHILATERYAYPIYGDDYGVEFQQYIGKGFSYLKATVAETLRAALLQDDRITGVDILEVTQRSADSAHVVISVQTNLGRLETEVGIHV